MLERAYGLEAQLRYVDWWRREAWDALGFLYREEVGRAVELPNLTRDNGSVGGALGQAAALAPVTPGHVVRAT